jgi:hypothetical protein
MRQADAFQHLQHPRLALGARQVADAEGDVVVDVQMRKQRIVLEHHADAPILGLDMGRRVGEHAAVHAHAARGQPFQPRHRAQQRRLAAARRPDQHADLALGQRQADAGHRIMAGAGVPRRCNPRPGEGGRGQGGRSVAAAGGIAHADIAQIQKHALMIPAT